MKHDLLTICRPSLRCETSPLRRVTLSEYVARRLGRDSRSQVVNFLSRPFGAPTFAQFWWYWNPVFGYYLYYQCYKPLRRFLSRSVSVLMTFLFCGVMHDLPFGVAAAFSGVRPPSYTITAMFMLLGLVVIVTERVNVKLARVPVWLRWVIHAANIFICWRVALYLTTAG